MATKLPVPTAKFQTPSSAPSPTPSTGSAPAGTKRKRNGPTPVTNQVSGVAAELKRELLNQFAHCKAYLKEQRKEKTFEEIVSYLSLKDNNQYALDLFKRLLQNTEGLIYNPQMDTYSYRPAIPVTNGDQLVAYLANKQSKDTMFGARIEDIKDGWREIDGGEKLFDTLDRMEREDKILISRDKARRPRMVYPNDRSLFPQKIDDDMKIAWHKIEINESSEELRAKLEQAGLKAATEAKEIVTVAPPKRKKPKAPKRGGRQTNVHMQHILKDYSDRRA